MLSNEKQIENLLVAQAMFQDIPQPKVCLGIWTNSSTREAYREGEDPVHKCGSAACFGGWIALHPHFQKQGVRPSRHDGSPEMKNDAYMDEDTISERLFGDSRMFASWHWATSGANVSDRVEVFARIKHALEKLTA